MLEIALLERLNEKRPFIIIKMLVLVVFCFLFITYRKFVFFQFQEEAFVTILTPVKKSIKSGKLLESGHICKTF